MEVLAGRFRLVGAKPLELMAALLRDYALPGDTVVDLYAGTGTTLAAALRDGCRAVGAEVDPERFRLAVERLRGEERRAELAARQKALFPAPTRGYQLEIATEGEEERGSC